MSKRFDFAVIIFVLLILTTAASGSVDSKSLEAKLNQVKGWEFGQSRAVLTEIEELSLRKTRDAADLKVIEKSFCEFLQSDATAASKQFICRQLSVMGSGACVDVLGGMLIEEDTSDMARYALERIGGVQAEGAFVNALDAADDKIKVGIVNSLGVMGSEAAVCKIEENLASSNAALASATANALGQIGGARATAALKKARSTTSGEVYQVVSDAYLLCADKLAEGGDKDKAVAIYDELMSEKESGAIRSAALRGKVLNSSEAASVISGVLSGDDAAMQTTAIGLISEVEGKEVLRAAASVMKRLGKTQQIQLLSVLSDKGDKDGMGAVMSLISSRDEEVRSAAIETVGYLGGAESVTLLAQVAATSKGSVKEASREALARLKGKEVDAAIGERIQGADAAIKAELVHALGSRYASGQMAVLLKSAADSDRKVRAEAIKGLRDIAGQAEMSELVSLMSTNKSSGERGEIAKTISAAAGRMCDKEARADEVLKELGSVKDSEIKVSLLELLGKLGGDRAYSVLSKSMISEDEGVRVAAIKGLSAWEDARPADVLLASVMGGKSDREKVLSLRGYIALAGLNSVDNVTKMKMYRKAMELCPSVNEKRLVFSGLSGTKDFAAMEMAVEYLDDAQLQAESQSAVLKVAFLIRGTECGKVRPILQKVSKEAKSKSLKASADKEIGKIKGL